MFLCSKVSSVWKGWLEHLLGVFASGFFLERRDRAGGRSIWAACGGRVVYKSLFLSVRLSQAYVLTSLPTWKHLIHYQNIEQSVLPDMERHPESVEKQSQLSAVWWSLPRQHGEIVTHGSRSTREQQRYTWNFEVHKYLESMPPHAGRMHHPSIAQDHFGRYFPGQHPKTLGRVFTRWSVDQGGCFRMWLWFCDGVHRRVFLVKTWGISDVLATANWHQYQSL